MIKWYRAKNEVQEVLWITRYTFEKKLENKEIFELEVVKSKRLARDWTYKPTKPFNVYVVREDLWI